MSTSELRVCKTRLPRSGVEISRIGLGLAHTRLLSFANRRRLLQRALELGITHFDTARLVTTFGASLDVVQRAETGWTESRFVPDITHSLFSQFAGAGRHTRKPRPVKQLLQKALARRQEGSVIVQTKSVAHLQQIVAWTTGR